MSRLLGFVWTALIVAVGALRRNALRALLTALGLLIGVAAVTIVVALAEGANRAVSGRIDSLGDNALIVSPEERIESGARGQSLGVLTEADSDALAREVPGVATTAPMIVGSAQVAWRDANSTAQIVGTTLGYFDVRAWQTSRGALWSASSEKLGEKVCLIGSTVQTDLFGTEDPVGQTLRIGRYPFRILGVLATKGQSPFGQDQDQVVVMPVSTVRAHIVPMRGESVNRVLISAATPERMNPAQRDATALLRQRHRLAEGAANDFSIRSQDDFRKAQSEILGVLSLLLMSVAAVSLIVGGIGVMNIMLVSVAERTREIGIRMAIGARENDILLQFLVEAVLLSLIGGLAGALLAALAVRGLARALDWTMAVSPQALGVALATSTVVGVLFGFLPARRAAAMDPIQALRRE